MDHISFSAYRLQNQDETRQDQNENSILFVRIMALDDRSENSVFVFEYSGSNSESTKF